MKSCQYVCSEVTGPVQYTHEKESEGACAKGM